MKILAVLFALLPFGAQADLKAAKGESEGMKFKVDVLVERQSPIWGFDFMTDGRIIFTERDGTLAVYEPKTKAVTELSGAPKVAVIGQGGMLDVRVHPKSGAIYLSYAEPTGTKMTTAVGRGTLKGNRLADFKRLFSAREASDKQIHFGSRIEFMDGALFVTVGDRDDRHQAQNLKVHNGKVIRMSEDGANPEVWSYGHRNPQGLTKHPETDELWEAEMGPRGGDEINVIRKGANYGWPVITYGREYWGPRIGEGTSKPGMEQPVVYWVPSISPSAIGFYSGDVLAKWKGNLFVACLSGQQLRRLALDGQKVLRQEVLLDEAGVRFRNVRQGPDGFLYFSTDEGHLGRIVPGGS